MKFSFNTFSLASIALSLVSSVSAAFDGCPVNLAVQITTNLQTGNIHFDYANCHLDDTGNGYAVGILNFLTNGPDVYQIVNAYDIITGSDNEFNDMRDTLKQYADDSNSSTEGLDGFCDAWKQAANNDKFKSAQNVFLMENYFTPSQEYASDLGLQLSVSKALMFDSGVVYGTDNSSGSLGGLIKKTNKLVTEDDINEGDEEPFTITNGDTEYKISEYKWLDLFLQVVAKKASNGEDNTHVKSYKYIIENNTPGNWNSVVNYINIDGNEDTVSCDDSYADDGDKSKTFVFAQ